MATGILSTGDKILNRMKEMDMGIPELCPDEEQYTVPVEKNTLAKLIVVSELNGVELNALVASILEKGIEENEFYD